MKIYFAGSIRGGREDSAIYQEIINLLKNYGQVLTEHIGDVNLDERGELDKTEEYIFERDLEWIKECDVLVAEGTAPSLGVGYEIATAEFLGKKVLVFYRPQDGKKFSAMMLGNKKINCFAYNTIDELLNIFEKELR